MNPVDKIKKDLSQNQKSYKYVVYKAFLELEEDGEVEKNT